MRFHLWGKSDREPDPVVIDGPEAGDDVVDIDGWLAATEALAGSDDDTDTESRRSPERLRTLRDNLLRVLEDEEASLVPPSAGDMTQAEWEALSDRERECYRRLQLRRIDPRLVGQATLSRREGAHRTNRVYR